MQHENEMSQTILRVTQEVIAESGMDRLSMQKIAQQADISPGTIYIHFKNKEDLLDSLVEDLIDNVNQQLTVDVKGDFYEEFKQMWFNLWNFFIANKPLTLNLHQYKSLPSFFQKVQDKEEQGQAQWINFLKRGIEEGVLVDLPYYIIFSLSLSTALDLASHQLRCDAFKIDEQTLQTVVKRSWLAISKTNSL